MTDPEWANLGQGAPEVRPPFVGVLPTHLLFTPIKVGDLPGGPPRPKTIDLSQWGDDVNEYGPTVGIKELREAVAVSSSVSTRDEPCSG